MYGEGAVTDQTCQKQFAKFCAGDFLLDDAPWSGRWVEVDSGQIQTLIENNHCYTTQEIADILKISKSIKLLVKINNVSFMENTKRTFWPTHRIEWASGKKGLCDFSSPLDVEYISLLWNYNSVKGVKPIELFRYLHLGNEVEIWIFFLNGSNDICTEVELQVFLPCVHFPFGIPNSVSRHPRPIQGPSWRGPDEGSSGAYCHFCIHPLRSSHHKLTDSHNATSQGVFLSSPLLQMQFPFLST